MARRIESHFLDGPAGKLECLLEEPEGQRPREVCVICHPHPLYGGTMLNKVVHRIARGLRRAGSVALRFNFRGVGRSQGVHDEGRGEIEDARAALAWLRARYPELPYALAGFSFGARVILNLGCSMEGLSRLIAVGFPASAPAAVALDACRTSKIFIQSTHDEYGPKADLERFYARLAEPKRLYFIEAEDHFFSGALDQLEETIVSL